ncbi:uncharacterized protein LOC129600288 [Paramacrobiotus metropolitanus]|uniref:uncharacterized protein LOC129600288 n=1 Tax=Paramacrobiotus metropolitanus TaxID=2943436 RepID=UPI002445D02A|nr:uncharacterized protein LOC129600288 [Paramacrobiotus metropolitanus]
MDISAQAADGNLTTTHATTLTHDPIHLPPTSSLAPSTSAGLPFADFDSYWHFHVYMLAFAFFSVSFCSFFSAINIRSQYPLQTLMFMACIFIMAFGLVRSGFLLLDPYHAQSRLPASLLTFLYSLGFPSLTATVAMTIFSIAKHCLRTEPKSFIYLIILLHFCFSITAEIIAVNEESWRLFLQTVTTIFLLWPLGLALLFGNIRKSLQKMDHPVQHALKKELKPAASVVALPPKKKRAPKRDRRKFTDSAAQTSFLQRRPTPKPKSKSCGTINEPPSGGGSQLTMPTSSVVSIDSLESWDHFSLQDSPRVSPVLTRHFSMPAVTHGTAARRFWKQFTFRKNQQLTNTSTGSSPVRSNSSSGGRKLRSFNFRWRKPVLGGSMAAAAAHYPANRVVEREVISAADSDQAIHKDQDSTLINYFTSPDVEPLSAAVAVEGGCRPTVQTALLPVPVTANNNSSSGINLRRLSNTEKSLLSDKMWISIRAHYVLIVLYLTLCGLYLYSVFKYPVDIQSLPREVVWDWFTFHSCLRTMELLVSVCLAYILDHAGALENCNIRQRELLRI